MVAGERSEPAVDSGHRLTLVAIGASAGGLKALQAFFDRVPADSGMAFVVIMHLDPDRDSRIAEILQDRAAIPVNQVADGTRVQPNHAYVIPPGLDLEITESHLDPATDEIGSRDTFIGTSTLLAAWNAATYVAQIEDERLTAAMSSSAYLDATREVLRRHAGLWFNDESYLIKRLSA